VVDDAIIIVENSSYYIEQGMSPKKRIRPWKSSPARDGHHPGAGRGLPARRLPARHHGQIFRQFALVIAATAVISALNALTLKPVQCATWLRPRGTTAELVLRGFNRRSRA